MSNIPTNTQLVAETAVSIAFYAWIVMFLGPKIRSYFEKQPYWEDVKKRRPNLLPEGQSQEDLIYMSCITVHHLAGGFLLLAGFALQNTLLVRAGALCELGFELLDLTAMALKKWPHEELKMETFKYLFAHHLPGLWTVVPFIKAGLLDNWYGQLIGAALLSCGALACLAIVVRHSLDMEKDLLQLFLLDSANYVAFVAARFAVFPFAMHGILKQLYESDQHIMLIAAVALAGLSMSYFNFKLHPKLFDKCKGAAANYFFNLRKAEKEKAPLANKSQSAKVQPFQPKTLKKRTTRKTNKAVRALVHRLSSM